MRASMSVPGLMAPVDYQGRKLVDGGLVDNVPIDVVRDHCQADIVIAVNVGSPLMKAEDVGSLLTVSVQMVNILTEQNVTRSLATLKPTDIYIKPDLEGITAGDFVKSSETADRGREAALAVADRLQALAVSDEVYSAWVNRITYVRNASPVINEIQVAGLKVVNPAAVERQIQARSGERLDETTLNRDMLRIYGDGWFESVDYAVLSTRDRNILRVLPAEKSWGPNYLRFGINLESNFSLDSTYSLRVAYDKTWLNPLGGELIVAAEIGNAPGVLLDYYQPLEAQQRYFFDSSLAYGGRPFNLYQDDNKVAEYWRTRGLVSAGVGINVGLLGQIRTGWRQIWQEATLETGIPSAIFPAKTSESYGGEYVTLDFDQMDRLFFPSRGWSSKLA
jgi:NTE family protein